jgi:calcineurin-like phosphoesterase family protein
MNWVTADHHFGHTNIIAYEARPFASAPEMDAVLVERWNRVVRPDDTVFHLGDFALAPKSRIRELVAVLHGRKVLVRGNHDGSARRMLDCGFDEVHDGPVVLYGDGPEVRLLLSHWPIRGLTSINVAVENWDYRPIPMPTPRGWTLLCGHTHRRWIVTGGTARDDGHHAPPGGQEE